MIKDSEDSGVIAIPRKAYEFHIEFTFRGFVFIPSLSIEELQYNLSGAAFTHSFAELMSAVIC